ncbi:MAG TPA: cupin domain-containing protein [Solirubrobacteraceae bacterium]
MRFDLAQARDAFRREAFVVAHNLAAHELFTLDRLADLADRLPADVVEHNLGSVSALEPGGAVPKLDLPPGEVVRGIEENGSWVALPIMLADRELPGIPEYQALYNEVIDALAPIVPGGRAAMSGFHSVIFVASSGSTTPSHLDGEIGFLLHVHGGKRLSIGRYASAEREREELEAFHLRAHRNTGELPVDVRHIDLEPGAGVHVPPLTPHWVTTDAGLAISLSVGFQTPENLRRAGVYRFNARARKLGLSPRPYGEHAERDRLKAGLVAGAAGAKRRLRRRVA